MDEPFRPGRLNVSTPFPPLLTDPPWLAGAFVLGVLERVDIQVVHMKALTIARIERNARGV